MAVRMDATASVSKGRDINGIEHFVGEFYADETADIKNKVQLGSVIAEPDSTAYVVKAGKLYVMASDSKWYDTDGTEVS
jgi:hypothetical protein